MPWAWAVMNSHMATIKKVELIRKRGGTCIIAVLSPWRPRPPPCGAPRIAPFWEATSRGRLRCAWTSACWTPGYLEEGGRSCSLTPHWEWVGGDIEEEDMKRRVLLWTAGWQPWLVTDLQQPSWFLDPLVLNDKVSKRHMTSYESWTVPKVFDMRYVACGLVCRVSILKLDTE